MGEWTRIFRAGIAVADPSRSLVTPIVFWRWSRDAGKCVL